MTTAKFTQYLHLAISLFGTTGVPALASGWLNSHKLGYFGAVAASILLHAICPSIFGGPSDTDKAATGLKAFSLILFMLLIGSAATASAQAATPAPAAPAVSANGFAASSDAVAIHYKGGWSAGTHIIESYDFLDFGKDKTNHLYLEGHELLAPTPGFSIYAGGITFQPDLTKLLNKTNVQANSLNAYFTGAAGNGVPTTGGSHISFLAGGGVKYNLTQALTWNTLQAQYGRFGSNGFGVISTGLSFFFGK